MRPASQIQATIELFHQIDASGKPADRCVSAFFKQRRYMGSKDKRAISDNLYTLLRNKLGFIYVIEKTGHAISPRLFCAALLKQRGENIHDTFNGEIYSPEKLTAQEIEVIDAIDFATLKTAPLHIQLNLPEWMLNMFSTVLKEDLKTEIQTLNQRASTDIRVNTLLSTTEEVHKVLKKSDSEPTKTTISPWGLRFNERVSLLNDHHYKKGWFDIQDEGSQLLALVTGAKPDNTVIDYCAGAGGKTLAIAAMMKNKGHIEACDIHLTRLQELKRRCTQAGVKNVSIHTLTDTDEKWINKHKGKADIVLIDAPCSGSGTWRRSPDSRWNLNQASFSELLSTQQGILQSASQFVKIDGQIIYATCSLWQEENEKQIEIFLANNTHFTLGKLSALDLLKQHQGKLDFSDAQLRTYPKRSDMDGFFACALRKTSESPS